MAAPTYLFEQADLERALGGARVAVMLLDKDRDGVADADQVVAVREEASAETLSYIGVNVDLDALAASVPNILRLKAATIGAYHAWLRGSEGHAVPGDIERRYEQAVAWTKDAGRRAATLGISPTPSTAQPVVLIDPDPDGTGVSRAGFARGFR